MCAGCRGTRQWVRERRVSGLPEPGERAKSRGAGGAGGSGPQWEATEGPLLVCRRPPWQPQEAQKQEPP